MARKQFDADLGDGNHIVESGDILYDLAKVYYGDGNLWKYISEANGNISPGSLQPGLLLAIPCTISIREPVYGNNLA